MFSTVLMKDLGNVSKKLFRFLLVYIKLPNLFLVQKTMHLYSVHSEIKPKMIGVYGTICNSFKYMSGFINYLEMSII